MGLIHTGVDLVLYPVKHPLPEEIAGSQKHDHGFLALLGDDGLLDLAALSIEDRIRRIVW
jgi:hypothetical protein